jgi:hypothetical protein
MEQVKNEPECVAASLSGNILVPKTLLLGIYLSQLIPKIHKKMVIDEPEKLQVFFIACVILPFVCGSISVSISKILIIILISKWRRFQWLLKCTT